jgi:putative transposase
LLVSLVYLLFRRALEVAALRLRSREFKEVEIVVLRHELAVLSRQVGRPRLGDSDRVFLAAASRVLRGTGQHSFFVRPDTLLRRHRQLVRKRWTYAGRRPGRPAISEDIRELVLRVARENPCWGYQRIVGELAGVGVQVAATTVRSMLRQAGMPPADTRAGPCWREFLHAHARSMIACDFFTVETLWLGRLYVLFFIELASRRVHVAGCTQNPSGTWTAQQARQLAWSLSERLTPLRFLIHDRDASSATRSTRSFEAKASRSSAHRFGAEGERVRRALGRHCPTRLPRLDSDRQSATARPRATCLRRPLQQPQAASSSRPDTPNSRAAATSCQLAPTGSRPPTRSSRRTHPRIRHSRMTDGFTHPTGPQGGERPHRADLVSATVRKAAAHRTGFGMRSSRAMSLTTLIVLRVNVRVARMPPA